MDKRSVLVVSLFSLFLLFSFRGYADPVWSNYANNTPPNYDPNYLSEFNVTWTNANTVLITITNSTGEVLINNATMSNETYGGDIYNFSTVLPAGTDFSWTSYANNTTDNWNTSDTWSFSIGQTPTLTRLFLDGNEGNKNYNLNYQNANFTAVNVQGKNINLTSNMTGINQIGTSSIITKTVNLTNSGLFYLNASFDGDQNYSSNFVNYYFYITPWSINTASPSSPVTYQQGRNYQFNVTWQNKTPINNVYFVWNGANVTPTGNRTINANTTEFYLNRTDLSANPTGYPYYLSVNDTNGNIISSDQWNYIINQIPIILSWTNPPSSPPWMVTAGTVGTIVRCLASDQVNLTLTVNSGGVSSNIYLIGSVSDSPSSSTAATYLYSCYPTNGNYSGSIQATLYFQISGTSNPGGNQGGNPPPSGIFTIKSLTSALTAMTGQSTTTQFTVSNGLQNNLANLSIFVKGAGIDSSWYSLSKFNSTIGHGLSQLITITFNIPNSAEIKDYTIEITATGKDISTNKFQTTLPATMKLTVNSSQPQPIQPLPSETVESPTTSQDNNTANITSNQTSVATGLAPAFEFFKNNLVIILAVAACLLIFIFRNNLTTALGGTLGKEEPEKTHKAKTASPLKGIKDKLNYKLIVNLKKESKAKSLNETEVQGAEKIPEMVPEKGPKRPAMLEKEIKRNINELQSILEAEKKVGKSKKKFDMKNN